MGPGKSFFLQSLYSAEHKVDVKYLSFLKFFYVLLMTI